MQDVQVGQSSATANYTWNGVVEFLQEQVRQNTIKQNEWLLEKQQLLVYQNHLRIKTQFSS